MDQQIPQQQQVLASSLAAKANSKYEIYVLLCIEAKIYLPKSDHITIYFLKDLIRGVRKGIKQTDVCKIYVPQYETLTIQRIFNFLLRHQDCFIYYPQDNKEIMRLPKQWICDVAATVIGDPFRDWVRDMVNDRNQQMAVTKNMFVQMDPDIYKAFMDSTAVSRYLRDLTHLCFITTALKGTGANLCKTTSKRRRTKAEVAQEKLERANHDQAMQAKEEELQELKDSMDNFSDKNPDVINRVTLVTDLINNGIIQQDQNGVYQLKQNN